MRRSARITITGPTPLDRPGPTPHRVAIGPPRRTVLQAIQHRVIRCLPPARLAVMGDGEAARWQQLPAPLAAALVAAIEVAVPSAAVSTLEVLVGVDFAVVGSPAAVSTLAEAVSTEGEAEVGSMGVALAGGADNLSRSGLRPNVKLNTRNSARSSAWGWRGLTFYPEII